MLILPTHIPCASTLRDRGHAVSEVPLRHRAEGAKCVLLLNLMPEKAACELQLASILVEAAEKGEQGVGGMDVQIIPVKIPGQTYKTTPMEHMLAFYEDICPDTFSSFPADSLLIVTGAPLENVAYEDVRYWSQLTTIMNWAAQGGVARTLNLCWASFAALYHFYRIPTHHLQEKCFGVYEVPYPVPTSRHITLHSADFANHPGLRITAESAATGPCVVEDDAHHMTNIMGHLEYEADRLHFEYVRDLSRGKPIKPAENYYKNDIPGEDNIMYSWRQAAITFYRNFLIG